MSNDKQGKDSLNKPTMRPSENKGGRSNGGSGSSGTSSHVNNTKDRVKDILQK